MTKPNFKEMTRKELRKYVIIHRQDEEAIHELFINRSTPNAKIYPAPKSLDNLDIAYDALIKKIHDTTEFS